MTRVGNYQIIKTDAGYVLTTLTLEVVGTFRTARAANAEGVKLTIRAHKARVGA